jgi:hypothetical protein
MRYVEASESSLAGKRGLKLRGCGSTGADLNKEVESGAVEHEVESETTSPRRRSPEPRDTW